MKDRIFLKAQKGELIFSLNLSATDFLEKDSNILSKFILHCRNVNSGEIQKAKELKAF